MIQSLTTTQKYRYWPQLDARERLGLCGLLRQLFTPTQITIPTKTTKAPMIEYPIIVFFFISRSPYGDSLVRLLGRSHHHLKSKQFTPTPKQKNLESGIVVETSKINASNFLRVSSLENPASRVGELYPTVFKILGVG